MNAVVHAPVVVRSPVPVMGTYANYREYLRFDFFFSCAYCNIAETEAQGVGFQIDHFVPQVHGGTNDYDNLMWSCQICNRAKSAIWPNDEERDAGFRYIRPDLENPIDHYALSESWLISTSTPGEFTVEVLFLNRPMMRLVREARAKMQKASETIIGGLQQLGRVRVDHLKADARTRFLASKERALAQFERLKEVGESDLIVRVLNYSPILDPDPEVRKRNQTRREYLKGIGVRTNLSFEETA